MARKAAAARRKDSADPPRAPAAPKAVPGLTKLDGWENVLTGLGTARDKRTGGAVSYKRLSYVECEDLWRGDDMAAKVVEEPAREMTRRWLDVQIENEGEDDVSETKADAELVEKDLKRLKAQGRVREAIMRQRAYGGAVLLVGADDGVADISKPLREATLKRIRFLTVFDAWEVYPRNYYQDAEEEGYGEPETYWIYPQGLPGGLYTGAKPTKATTTIVHESRLLRFEGIRVSRRQARENRGWGDSVFVRMQEVLQDFGMSWGGAAHLLQDFSQAVFKMRGLFEALAAGNEALVQQRLAVMDECRSMLRAVLLDAGDGTGPTEEFERKATPVTGLADLLDRFCNRLAAAADMPVTRLMGQSPAGLNATGAQDENWWFDRIAGLQDEVMREPLERLIHLLFVSKEGPTDGAEPENWSLVWRPLKQLSPMDEATRRKTIVEMAKAAIESQMVMPEEAGVSIFGGDEFSADIQIDKELRATMAENTAAELENQATALESPNPGEPGGPPKPPPPAPAPGVAPGTPVVPPGAKPPKAAKQNGVPDTRGE